MGALCSICTFTTSNSSIKQSQNEARGNNEVILIATKMGSPILGFQAYHTSIEINGTEFFFDGNGVMTSSNRKSHQLDPQNPNAKWGTTAIVAGYTNKSKHDLEKLRQ